MQRKLKKQVVYALYGLAFCFMIAGLFFIESNFKKDNYDSLENYDYVTTNVIEDINVPVVATNNIISRPYKEENVNVVLGYYDMLSDEESQKKSIIYYQDTYMQSSGISYSSDKQFDVLSILDGKVTEIKEDNLLGNVITIEHSNGIISSYQGVTDIEVKQGEEVKQGDIIAKSSKLNLLPDVENQLYFELIINGTNVNPDNYYDKSIDEV